jgi:hypothetical protein
MDCNTARLLLFLARPRTTDCDVGEAQALENHISQCTACGILAQSEQIVEKRIAQAVQSVPIAADLHSRIAERMALERRQSRRRVVLNHPRVAAGIAAAILAASFFGAYLAMRPLPVVDSERWLENALAQRGQAPQAVEQSFREVYGIETVAPPNFDYTCLDSYDLIVDPSGRRLPQLIFIRGNERARVLILTNKEFNWTDALSNPPANSGGLKVELRLHPGRPDVAYLIIHGSNSLDWLVTEDSSAA